MSDADRLERYLRRKYPNDIPGRPTVRMVARALRLRQGDIEELVDGDGRFSLTSYLTCPPTPLGEHYVEIDED